MFRPIIRIAMAATLILLAVVCDLLDPSNQQLDIEITEVVIQPH